MGITIDGARYELRGVIEEYGHANCVTMLTTSYFLEALTKDIIRYTEKNVIDDTSKVVSTKPSIDSKTLRPLLLP